MNDEATKTCRYCAEQIKATAKVCPRCRQWLPGFSLRNPAILIFALCLWCFICFVVMATFFKQLVNPGVDFSAYRNSISVVDSRMTFGMENKEPVIYVVTVITNKSDLVWKGVELDARFFDKTGTLIDAQAWCDNLPIWPHGDSAFRIRVKPSHDLSDYQSYKLFVRSARDVHARF